MNFLGHLYFSDNDPAIMYANIFGDFVKGSDLSGFLPEVEYGIRLHREIDSYTDTHPEVRKLLHILYPSLPKIASIAIDLFFDHLLAKNWNAYHPLPLDDFLNNFYNYPFNEADFPDETFLHMLFRLRHGNWIKHYETLDGLEKACIGVSRRISFPNTLFNGRSVFETHETAITQCFEAFLKDAVIHFREYHKKHR